MKVSIVVPVYNEQATILPLLEAVRRSTVPSVERASGSREDSESVPAAGAGVGPRAHVESASGSREDSESAPAAGVGVGPHAHVESASGSREASESSSAEATRVGVGPHAHVEFEVIVVDDGSADATPALLESRPDLYSRSIRLAKNGGKGAAVKAGLAAATGDYVLFQDADLEYNPAEYPKLIHPVVTYGADMVMGSRTLAPTCRRVHYFWNMVGNTLVTFAFNVLFNRTFSDVYTCYVLFRRDLVDPSELRTTGFDQQAELLAKCVKRGRIFYDVPIEYHGRPHEEGKKIRATDVPLVLFAMIRERMTPGR